MPETPTRPRPPTRGDRTARLELLDHLEDVLQRVRQELLASTTLGPAMAIERHLAAVIIQAKCKIDDALEMVESERRDPQS